MLLLQAVIKPQPAHGVVHLIMPDLLITPSSSLLTLWILMESIQHIVSPTLRSCFTNKIAMYRHRFHSSTNSHKVSVIISVCHCVPQKISAHIHSHVHKVTTNTHQQLKVSNLTATRDLTPLCDLNQHNHVISCIVVANGICDRISEKVSFPHILHTSKQNNATLDSLY